MTKHLIPNQIGIFVNKNTSCGEIYKKVNKIINDDFKTFEAEDWSIKILHNSINENNCLLIQTEVGIYEVLFIDENWNIRGKRFTQIYYDANFSKGYINEVIIPKCTCSKSFVDPRIENFINQI